MKKLAIFAAAAVATVFFAFKQVDVTGWVSDSVHSRLGFTVTHLGIADFNGSFGTYDIKITGSKPDFSDAVVEMTGDANSIYTGNEGRDKHLKSADFFDTEKYPNFSYKSTSFKKSGKDEYTVTGQLTLHGVTKDVTLKAKHVGNTVHPMSKKEMTGFKVTGTFKRSDFGIAPSTPSAMVSDDVTLNADLEFAKN